MKTPASNNVSPSGKKPVEQGVRPAVQIVLWLACLACAAIVVIHARWDRSNQSAAAGRAEGISSAQSGSTHPPKAGNQNTRRSTGSARPVAFKRTGSFGEPLPALRHMVGNLTATNLIGGPMTEQQAVAWREMFRQLVQQGDAAVPAIREYLNNNSTGSFGGDAVELIGYASTRTAMIDALIQIGSPLATQALAELLGNTVDPQEIAQTAAGLEKLAPGAYQLEVVDAARRALGQIAAGRLDGPDVAPLFQLLQQYGGANVVRDLEGNMAQWNYYANMTLAQLPDEAGVPSLIQAATGQTDGGSGARTAALATLAGLAGQSTTAANALADQVRQNRLSAYDWTILAPFLAGNQMIFQDVIAGGAMSLVNSDDIRKTMVSAGNQSFYTAPLAALTPAQIDRQEAFIDQLLSLTSDATGIQILNQSRSQLESRRRLLALGAGTTNP